MLVAGGHGCLLCYYLSFGTNYERSTLALSISNAVINFSCKGIPQSNLKTFFLTSREGLCQVYDGRYKFLLVTDFGGH
jgi:hypothetical protein